MFTIQERQLGLLLGLGDLAYHDQPHCHGYANCCNCPDCQERAKNAVRHPTRIRQPWEPRTPPDDEQPVAAGANAAHAA